MNHDASTEPGEEEREILRDVDIAALEDCPEALSAARWICGILRSLENLTRLPDAEETKSHIKKATRLKMQLERLFGYLSSPFDSEITESDSARFGILGFTDSGKSVTVGPITAGSACYATVHLASALLLCLDRRTAGHGIPPLKRFSSSSLTALKPRLRDEGSCKLVLDWIRTQLPAHRLDGLHEQVVAEVRQAARLYRGLVLRRDDPHLEGLKKVIVVVDRNGDLDMYSELILVALYDGQTQYGDEMIQETLAASICELEKRLGKEPRCKRRRVSERLPGLKVLGYIEQPSYRQPRLTEQGRRWVEDSDVYRRSRAT